MPNYTHFGDGLHVESVIKDRPAQTAGILKGDIITKIGDCEIKEVYTYMTCMAKLKSGDQTTATIKRKGEVEVITIEF